MEIKYDNVTYKYNEKTPLEQTALQNISLKIKKGKINGVIGPSGAGKTTFVELMNALMLPTEGTIRIEDYILEHKRKVPYINDLRFNIGLVFQFPEEQFFNATVKQEIEFGMKQFSYKLDNIDKRASDALKMVGLNDSYLERSPFSLSNGEMRKVAIASVLAFNPKVIILDEPTIGLDTISKKTFLRMLKTLKNRYHKTIIVVSHDVNMIHKIVDYLFVLDHGKLVLEGDKYEVFTNENLDKYQVARPNIIEFSYKVMKKKGIKIGYRDEINDLIKDIYRHVS